MDTEGTEFAQRDTEDGLKEYTREKRFKTRSVAGTLAIAQTIAEMLAAPRVVVLKGELGAGKTTLVKGWVSALGAGGEDEVTSPTFTLVHEYAGPKVKVYHLDLYRLETERELATLGFEEMSAHPDAVVLVEWGEKFASVMERADAEVAMAHLDGDERSLWVRWRD
jgi:tRNA threonylcarbamoyladenosine biosynthesis protein TsaE